ncbi:hypothetical protein [Kitasatospora sp. NPDC058218]|uniref:hypothetical protein n=1 Tax=Kitasatospora sp. NPDC058218 TaxID=3346385 RepID=UPI0036DDF2AA
MAGWQVRADGTAVEGDSRNEANEARVGGPLVQAGTVNTTQFLPAAPAGSVTGRCVLLLPSSRA